MRTFLILAVLLATGCASSPDSGDRYKSSAADAEQARRDGYRQGANDARSQQQTPQQARRERLQRAEQQGIPEMPSSLPPMQSLPGVGL